jgi:uncharacterized protein YjiS (DUF1127 family)
MFITRSATTFSRVHLNPLDAVVRAFRVVDLALKVRRERRELAALDDRMLADIGLSRSLVHEESARDLLDLPPERIRRERF